MIFGEKEQEMGESGRGEKIFPPAVVTPLPLLVLRAQLKRDAY